MNFRAKENNTFGPPRLHSLRSAQPFARLGAAILKGHMTLLAANALVRECDALFKRAALAWERGQNSGNNEKMEQCEKLSARYQEQAEKLLKPLGIECDYPGLYPSFKVNGSTYHSTESAVSEALEQAGYTYGRTERKAAA